MTRPSTHIHGTALKFGTDPDDAKPGPACRPLPPARMMSSLALQEHYGINYGMSYKLVEAPGICKTTLVFVRDILQLWQQLHVQRHLL